MEQITKPKGKQKRKEKRKGQRSGCTFLLTLAVIFIFVILVLLIKGPAIDRPIPLTSVVLGLTPDAIASLTFISPTVQPLMGPSIVPTGQIAYVQDDVNGSRLQIHMMGIDGGNSRLVVSYPLPSDVVYYASNMIIGHSSNGHIVFEKQSLSSARSIYMINTDGTNERHLIDASALAFSPAMSQDGKQIVYVSLVGQGWRQINVMDIDGSNHKNLTASNEDYFGPLWMPDGKHISFISDRDGQRTFYLMDADGSNVRKIPLRDDRIHLAHQIYWSPDGKYLAFSEDNGDSRLSIANADGSSAHTVSDIHIDGTGTFAWTSDSKSIIFAALTPRSVGGPEPNGIWMINIDGTNLHQLVNVRNTWSPVWMP